MADSKIYDEIDQVISGGKYNDEWVKGPDGKTLGSINKCNLFTDDVLKKYWGVELPRRKELAKDSAFAGVSSSPALGGGFDTPEDSWPDNPVGASVLDMYYSALDSVPDSGVYKVDPERGRKLAAGGLPVLAVGGGHATIAAPGDSPSVFRPSIAGRGEDKRTRVGVKPDGKLRFYYIDPEKYKGYRDFIVKSKISIDDVVSANYKPGAMDKLMRKKK